MTAPAHDPFRGAAPRRAVAAAHAAPAADADKPDAATPPAPAHPGDPGQPDLPGSPPGAPGPDPAPVAVLVDGEHRPEDQTIGAWLDWVGDDRDRAQRLHAAETGRGADARTTLLDKLDHLLSA